MEVYTPAGKEFLSEVAQAYHNSPEEIALVLGLFGALAIGLTIYLIVSSRRIARERREWSAREFERILQAREVPPSGADALETMAQLIGKPQEKHRLLTDPSIFDRAARLALKGEEVRPETVSALRVLLNISRRNGAVPRSTVELPVGSAIKLRRSGRKVFSGRVSAQRPDGFTVDVGSQAPHFPAGGRVELQLKTPGGVFRFHTFSQGFSEGHVQLRHREEVNHRQQRRHYRRQARVHARVEPVGGDGEWTRLEDLGGGGASFSDPTGALSEGDSLVLSLPGIGVNGGELRLPGRVLRISAGEPDQGAREGPGLVHVAFSELSEGDRDRIYRLLFSLERKKKA